MAQLFKLNANWQLLLQGLGIEPATVLRRAELPLDLLSRESAAVTAEEYFRMWDSLEIAMGDRPMALEIGRGVPVEAFDPAIFAAFCSPDLKRAVDRLSRFKRLIGPLTVRSEFSDNGLVVAYGTSVGLELQNSFGMMELVFLVEFARRATQTNIHPIKVTSLAMPSRRSHFEDFFGVRIMGGSSHSLTFTVSDATRPFLTSNTAMWRFFEPVLEQRLEEVEQAASTTQRVQAALFEILPSGRNSIQDVSASLGVSARTLQRNLRREGTTFQDVLNATRERLARHYLRNTAMTSGEISFMLGYDDPNSFFRAFRTWTGQTPESVRASV